MFNWFRRKVELKAVQAAEEDIGRFLKGLRGLDLDEVAMIVAVATHWRNVFATKDIDLLQPEAAERKKPMLLMQINQLLKEVQREMPAMAAGLMVWLHTVRAANMPEIRAQGRELWAELAQAFGRVEAVLGAAQDALGLDLMVDNPAQIPVGLEPRR